MYNNLLFYVVCFQCLDHFSVELRLHEICCNDTFSFYKNWAAQDTLVTSCNQNGRGFVGNL